MPSSSGQEIGYRDRDAGAGQGRDGLACTQDSPRAVEAVHRFAVNLQSLLLEVEDPGFRDPCRGVEGELALAIVKERVVGDLDDEQCGRGMAVAVIPRASGDHRHIRFRRGAFPEGKGRLDAEVTPRESGP